MMTKKKLIIAMGLAVGSLSSYVWAGTPVQCVPTTTNTCVYTYDASAYGNTARVTFNNWGYAGPTGVGVNDFQVGTGFDATQIGQRQNVVTLNPDWNTSDPVATRVIRDPVNPGFETVKQTYLDANMDATVQFYAWAYTTVGGSTFTDMKIDKAGNYSVAKNDMAFQFYDVYQYHDGNTTNGTTPDSTWDTKINFQPYAISDARGWCGSVLTSGPNSLEQMAGQVTFDFAFDAYMLDGTPVPGAQGGTQVVPSFVMRSYGDYTVESELFGDPNTVDGQDAIAQYTYRGSAVGNNTNPTSVVTGVGGTLDANWQNKVSFLGAGVVPKGVWVKASSYQLDQNGNFVLDGNGNKIPVLNANNTWDVTIVETAVQTCDPGNPGAAPEAGATCYQNSFAGYPFLLRADGQRTVTYINPDGWSNYAAPVPVPAAVWLFGSGLLGLVSFARRRRKA